MTGLADVGGAELHLIPSGVSSNAQARTSAIGNDGQPTEQLHARERERRATERLVARQGEDAKRASLRRRTSVDAGEFQCICYAK